MSTRTIIEINHDYIGLHRTEGDLLELLRLLPGSQIPADLNRQGGGKFLFSPAIMVLGQRHHSEPEWKQSTK